MIYENYMMSKYDVLVYDLNKLPSFNSGNRRRAGMDASLASGI